MPALSRWFIRTALLALTAGLGIGDHPRFGRVLENSERGLDPASFAKLVSVEIDLDLGKTCRDSLDALFGQTGLLGCEWTPIDADRSLVALQIA